MNRCYQCDAFTSDECQTASWVGFGLCGKCALDRKRSNGADAPYPRNRQGAIVSAASKSATNHRDGFRWRIASAAIFKAREHHYRVYGFRPESLTATSLTELLS